MKESIKNKVDLLAANRAKIEKEFKWGYNLMNIAAALVFTAAGREADIEGMKKCKEILKKNTVAMVIAEEVALIACMMICASSASASH